MVKKNNKKSVLEKIKSQIKIKKKVVEKKKQQTNKQTYQLNIKNIKDRTKLDNEIRLFLKELLKKDIKEQKILSNYLLNFKNKNNSSVKYFIDKINNLPQVMQKDFINEYLNQPSSYNIFSKTYFGNNENIIKINIEGEKEEKIKEELKVLEDLFEEDQIEDKEQFKKDINNIIKKTTKFIDASGKEIQLEKNKQKYVFNGIDNYKSNVPKELYSWVNNLVSNILISTNNNNFLNKFTIKNDNTEYSKPIIYNNKNWYKTNKNFYNLLHSNKVEKTQIRFNTIFKFKNSIISINIAYLTQYGDIIVQDEKIFNDFLKYKSKLKLNKKQKIENILSSNVNEEIKKLGISILSEELMNVSKSELYSEDSQYILDCVNYITSKSKNFKEFAQYISNIVVYLHNITQDINNNIFKIRISKEYYLPDFLVDLTDREKLPEVFSDDKINENIKKRVSTIVHIKKENFVKKMANLRLQQLEPLKRKEFIIEKQELDLDEKLNIPEWKSSCKNKEEVKNIPNENIIYYKDEKTGDTYCVDIKEIIKEYELFNDGEYTIPNTNVTISGEKFDRIINLYNNKNVNEKYKKRKLTQKTETKIQKIDYKCDLIKLLETQIKKWKEESEEDEESEESEESEEDEESEESEEEESEDEDEKEDGDTETNEIDNITKQIDNNNNISGEDKKSISFLIKEKAKIILKLSKILKKDTKELLYLNHDQLIYELQDNDKEKHKELIKELENNKLDICLKCKKTISKNNSQKSMLRKKGKNNKVHFCDLECFEEYDWKKLKSKDM